MIRAEFYIKVDKNGKQVPLMNTGSGNESYLSNLAIGRMGYSETVLKELEGIKKVIDKEKDKHFMSYSETICLEVLKESTLVYDSLGNVFFKPFEVDTMDIYRLLQEWYDFLLIYENGEIPGIAHRYL